MQKTPPPIQAIRSLGYVRGPLRSAIHRIKCHQDFGLAEKMGRMLAKKFILEYKWSVDIITAVRLAKQRPQDWGYYQTYLIVKFFAWIIQKPSVANIIKRKINTSPQLGLLRTKCQKNIQNAILGNPHAAGLRILILDDVTTTGSTHLECARILHTQGAKEIDGSTPAKTPCHSDSHNKINEGFV
jgi:competence protein ComFC